MKVNDPCGRCGHARLAHATGPNGGCTKRVRHGTGQRGSVTIQRVGPCSCPAWQEPERA